MNSSNTGDGISLPNDSTAVDNNLNSMLIVNPTNTPNEVGSLYVKNNDCNIISSGITVSRLASSIPERRISIDRLADLKSQKDLLDEWEEMQINKVMGDTNSEEEKYIENLRLNCIAELKRLTGVLIKIGDPYDDSTN